MAEILNGNEEKVPQMIELLKMYLLGDKVVTPPNEEIMEHFPVCRHCHLDYLLEVIEYMEETSTIYWKDGHLGLMMLSQ